MPPTAGPQALQAEGGGVPSAKGDREASALWAYGGVTVSSWAWLLVAIGLVVVAVIATGRCVRTTPEGTVTQYRRQGIVFRPLRDAAPSWCGSSGGARIPTRPLAPPSPWPSTCTAGVAERPAVSRWSRGRAAGGR
jgi:hypothetical protein